ncbi:MAG: S8 family serine peptidase [FCB group bacterium]|nr:S8 family serine peptidase [FCB group bacterium]
MFYRRYKHHQQLLLALALILSFSVTISAVDNERAACPGRVIIQTTEGFSPTVTSLLPEIGFAELKTYQSWQVISLTNRFVEKNALDRSRSTSLLEDLYIVSFPDSIGVREVLAQLSGHPEIVYAEPDYVLQLFDWPADSLFSRQWYLHNEGQEFYAVERFTGPSNDVLYLKTGKTGEDVNLRTIYDNPRPESEEVILAVLDTGIDYDHPDLADNIFINLDEIPDNGYDDDHNGLIDDYRGWDFSGDTINVIETTGDNDATDSIGHGTHVAGLVAAVENQIGIAGYPTGIKILPVKIFPNGFTSVAAAAIIYAADMNAKVINMSWGFPFESNILREAIKYAEGRGVFPVAAAGNFGDSRRISPAAIPESFTVGGTNSDGFMTYFSSYGPHLDIVAPGSNILSLRAAGTDLYAPDEAGLRIIAENYILADGTSMSAPLVAGAAALIMSFNPGLEMNEIKDALRLSADDLIDPFNEGDYLPGYDTLSGWGRLNVGAALDMVRAPTAFISSPHDGDIVDDHVVVGLSVTGSYGGPVSLYLGQGHLPDQWMLLHELDQAAALDSFYLWDSGSQSGYFVLRLVSDNGEDRVEVRVVNGRLAELTAPAFDEEVKYLVPIHISAFGLDYDSAVISIKPESESEYQSLFVGTRLFFDEAAFSWPSANYDEGYYHIRLTAHFGQEYLSDSVRVLVRSLMRPGFPANLPGYSAFSPGVADINGDGLKEIVVGCRSGLFAFDPAGNILPGFPVLSDVDMRSMPAFDDIDGDGLLDIIITGHNILTCYNYRGELLPGWPQEASTGLAFFSYPIPVPTELFNQSDSVIIYLSKYGEVRAYNYDGSSYFYSLDGLFTALDPNIFDTSLYAGLSVPYLTAANLDHMGANEVVGVYSTSTDPSGIYIWNGRNGLPPFGWESPKARPIKLSSGGVLADIDDDGFLETIMAGHDSIYNIGVWVTRNGCEDLPGWPVILEELSGWIGTAPVCVDIDANGSKEVVVTYYNFDQGRIYVFNEDGTPYVDNPGWPLGLLVETENTLANVIVADIDGNGLPNLISRGGYIFPGTGYEQVFAWEPNGALTPGFPIITPTSPDNVVSTVFTPVIDDLDNDGRMELIMCGDGSNLFVWNLEAPYDPDLVVWSRFRGDSKNSGINPDIGLPTAVASEAAALPTGFAVTDIYPNPFNPSTTISFNLDRAADINLDIFNILGQKVVTLLSGRHGAGAHTVIWDGVNAEGGEVASGVYLVRLSDERQYTSKKVVLMR